MIKLLLSTVLIGSVVFAATPNYSTTSVVTLAGAIVKSQQQDSVVKNINVKIVRL